MAGMGTINISKVGRATSVEGVAVDFTPEILREVAETYNPELSEAPLVIGHPKLDSPAWGYVGRVAFADGVLQVTEESQLDPDFAEMRRKGHFKHPSASFFTPTAPNNPTPGKWYLRHVGFLGGATPALKGLNGRTIAFADAEDGVVTFGDLPGYAGFSISRLLRGLRDWLIEKEGAETADRVLPDYEIESLRELSQRAADDRSGSLGPSFADPAIPPQENRMGMTDAEKAELEDARKRASAAETELARLQAKDAQAAVSARHARHVSFADGLVEAGRWPSGMKEVLVATLDHAATPPAQGDVVSFGDGDAARPLVEALQESLQQLPVTVSFGEVATRRGKEAQGRTDREIANRAQEYAAEQASRGKHVSFSDAVEHIRNIKE